MAKPVRQVNNNSGEKTCFRETQKKTRAVKLPRRMNHGNQNGDKSPGNQDARNPFPRTPAFHDQRSRNLKQKVASKKNPCAQSEYAIGEAQVVGHLQAGKTHVDAIEIRDEIKNEEKRQQSPRDAAPGSLSHF